ncbi:MAG: SUMF1/EgtB/PvdO family nonheme iron enzyme [Kiritimatiellae bacterium]|nr:SUMF1/EgtB/PvdO family nonheme iron enzyme [Kiritimatiellia bacterium]
MADGGKYAILSAGPSLRDGFNINAVVASHYLKENPDLTVTFVHPRSRLNGKTAKLSEVISVTADGRVRGWVNHRDHTGFIYTDLFRRISDEGGYTTPVDAYPDTKAACGALDMWGNCWEWTSTKIVARNGRERGETVNAIKGGSWYAMRNSCRTDYRGEGRRPGSATTRSDSVSSQSPRRPRTPNETDSHLPLGPPL